MSANFPAKNIEWTKIPVGAKVRHVTSKKKSAIPGATPTSWYVVGVGKDAAVAFWSGEDATRAQNKLEEWAKRGIRWA